MTAGFGKWHLTPNNVQGAAGPFDHWPKSWGFNHWWGFLSGAAGQYDPVLTMDDYVIGVPERKDGKPYYFPDDITDKAIEWVHRVRAQDAEKPWFMYYSTGCAHAPHHMAKTWADKYKGRFDDGWDALREQILARQKERGVVPPDTELTARPDAFPAWDSIDDTAKRLYARQMEVYCGYQENADWNVGRLLDAIEESGDLDNTLIIYIWGDNGASLEGTTTGSPGTFPRKTLTKFGVTQDWDPDRDVGWELLRDDDKVYETYWTTGRGNELMAPSYGLLDLTVYGRQEFWEDSPEGWPQRWVPKVASSGWTAARPPSGRGSGPGATTTSAQRRMVAIPSSTAIETGISRTADALAPRREASGRMPVATRAAWGGNRCLSAFSWSSTVPTRTGWLGSGPPRWAMSSRRPRLDSLPGTTSTASWGYPRRTWLTGRTGSATRRATGRASGSMSSQMPRQSRTGCTSTSTPVENGRTRSRLAGNELTPKPAGWPAWAPPSLAHCPRKGWTTTRSG